MKGQIESTKANPSQKDKAPKKRYEKPRIIYRAPLEAMAAICDGNPAGKLVGFCTYMRS